MKKPILFSVLAVVLAFCYCYWQLTPTPKPVAQAVDDVAPSKVAPSAALQVASNAPTVSAVQVVPQAPVTQDRRQIYDAPNVLATISDIRRSGSQDEKDWAISLLSSCTRLLAKPAHDESELENPKLEKVAGKPDDAQVAEQKKRATEKLTARCKGVDQLGVEERQALKEALSEGHSRNQSALGQLHAIDGDRWSGDQARLISESLYSHDPIVARTAFFTLLAAFDSNSPGGLERQNAFTLALGPQFTKGPLSEYEQLQGCRNMGWCGSSWGVHDDASPSSAVAELADKYRNALQSHADARSILAVR